MATRTWLGGTGDWYDATKWASGVPTPGDDASVFAGNAMFVGSEGKTSGLFDEFGLFVGSTNSNAPAQLTSTGASFGRNATLESSSVLAMNSAVPTYALFTSIGTTLFAGTIDAIEGGFEIQTLATATTPGGDFVLQTDGAILVQQADFYVAGRLDDEGAFTVGANGTLVNAGTIYVESAHQEAFSAGQTSVIVGGGTIAIGLGGVADVAGSVSNQTFSFANPGTYQGGGGVLRIEASSSFQASIAGFVTGDVIDVGFAVTKATYNVTTSTLALFQGMTQVATVHTTGPTNSATLAVSSDGNGGTLIELPNSPSLSSYYKAAGDIALGSNIVRATMTTHGGVPITGAGIKVGIISDSFNHAVSADPNTDAAGGYLPANPDGTSAVVVLRDDTGTGDEDEGRAMAELVHTIAPGAQIDFYSGLTTVNGSVTSASGAAAVNALVAAGCNIIVDDESYPDEPYFQVAGPLDTAIQTAINAGVSYFTSATNYGNAYYQAPFTATATTLPGVSGTVYAQRFTDGTTFQSINVTARTTDIVLGWDAPFPTTLAGTSPLAMTMVLYDANMSVVAVSTQLTAADGSSAYASEPEIQVNAPAGTYYISVFQTAAQRASTPVSLFKYELVGQPPGEIGDYAAGNGPGFSHGHDLVPGVNTVAASSYANSPAFTGDKAVEDFSANGPGSLLFAPDGTRYATPVNDAKPNFTAPDGINASSDLSVFQPFYGTSAAAPDAAGVAALVLQANPGLTPAQVTADLENSAINLGLPASDQGTGLIQAPAAVAAALACYATGTRLRTVRGDVAVEDLREGDTMRTAGGGAALIVWIGRRRVDCRRHPDPAAVWPVRVRAGAFAPNVPLRDLRLSPDHAVFAEGALVPVRLLVNGLSIVQEPVDAVTYWHVELPAHDLLLAEGLAAESYLDTGNRAAFANCGPTTQAHPDFARAEAPAACAKLLTAGPALDRLRSAVALQVNACREAA